MNCVLLWSPDDVEAVVIVSVETRPIRAGYISGGTSVDRFPTAYIQ